MHLRYSKFGEKIDALTHEVQAKDLELRTTSCVVKEAIKLPNEVAELREVLAKDEANVAIMSALQKEVLAVKKAVDILLLTLEKSRDLRVDADAEKKDCSADTELKFVKHQEKSSDKSMAVVHKEKSAERVECAALR